MSEKQKKSPSEYEKFVGFMKRLVRVPHSEIKSKLDAEKEGKRLKVKTSSSRA